MRTPKSMVSCEKALASTSLARPCTMPLSQLVTVSCARALAARASFAAASFAVSSIMALICTRGAGPRGMRLRTQGRGPGRVPRLPGLPQLPQVLPGVLLAKVAAVNQGGRGTHNGACADCKV